MPSAVPNGRRKSFPTQPKGSWSPTGITYNYYTSIASRGKSTLILFHGWPDSAKLWANIIQNHLLPAGYGIIAIDCLGYDNTSNPTDFTEYAFHLLAADAVAILDAERISSVISVGHDWGSMLAQRLYNFHPSRVLCLVMISVSYVAPNVPPFGIETALDHTRRVFGIYAAAHEPPESLLESFAKPDGMRDFVTKGKTQSLEAYAGGSHKAEFVERMTRDGFEGPVCWYKAYMLGTQNKSNKLAPQKTYAVKVPTLFWGGTRDMFCRPETLQPSMETGVLPYLTAHLVEEGHWALLARPETFGQDLVAWIKENLGDVDGAPL